jgi:3-phytase
MKDPKVNQHLIGVMLILVAVLLTTACQAGNATHQPVDNAVLEVSASVETEPVKTDGDSADDATLWVNPNDPSLSLVIGTNKQRGLAVYDLSGKEVQFLADGHMNNVDHRDNFLLGGKKVSLVTAGDRSDNSIAIYRVNPETRRLESVAARKITTVEAYGSCMYKSSSTAKFYYIVANKRGEVEQLELFDNGKGLVDARRARLFKLPTQLEGCVADDELDQLYIGEEAVGIWKYPAQPDSPATATKVDGVMPNGNLKPDVEGLTIAYGKNGKGYLIASSQGNNTYVMYRREGNNAYVKTFRIVAGKSIDEVSETDGIHVTTESLGPMFPNGVFIAQDGLDDKGKQNFKLVPWQLIARE